MNNDRIKLIDVKLTMKHIKKIVGFIVFIGLIFLFYKFDDYSHKRFLMEFKKEQFGGRIVKKYIDKKQHNYEMLVIQMGGGKDSLLNFSADKSGFYDFIQVNDSIIKLENSNDIRIINRGISFTISF